MDPACFIAREADLVSYRPPYTCTSVFSLAVNSRTGTLSMSVVDGDGAVGDALGWMMMVAVFDDWDTDG